MIRVAALAFVVASPAFAQVSVETVPFRQEFGPVLVERFAPGQAPVEFFGLGFTTGETTLTLETGDDGVTNPLYEGQTQTRQNPLYEGGDRGAPDLIAQVEAITFEFGPLVQGLNQDGIVHRDIAARNFVMTTDFGEYSSATGEEFLFGVDAPDGYFGNGPVTWTTTSAIRLYLDGDESSGDYFVFNGTWFTDTLVPAPGAAGLFGFAGLAAMRRRR